MEMLWAEALQSSDKEILSWAERESWARRMSKCGQDDQWHSEGDVWTHTKMVCTQLSALSEWKALPRIDQLKLLFTGLFHDAGKPATTAPDQETGRLRSPKHAQAGAEISRNILREMGCDLETREEITRLVRYHGRPPFLLNRDKPEQEVIHLSWFVRNDLLYLFALADWRGRKSLGSDRSDEMIHLWKVIAEENNCYAQPYPFANDHARFLYYRESLSSLHYTPHEKYRCKVTMTSGLPGAGKDTWLAQQRPNLPVVSLDAVRQELDIDATENQGEVIQRAREQCREYLRAGIDFSFNATNTTRLIRRRWLDLFADYDARTEIIYIEPPLHIISEQNRQRPDPAPTAVINRLTEKLDPPTITEAHEMQFGYTF
ncbi:MAG: AAA family ATPase [Verrucomicrobiales bacterium]